MQKLKFVKAREMIKDYSPESNDSNYSSKDFPGSLGSNNVYSWQPHPIESLKINVDDATGNQCAATTLIRDHNGTFLHGET